MDPEILDTTPADTSEAIDTSTEDTSTDDVSTDDLGTDTGDTSADDTDTGTGDEDTEAPADTDTDDLVTGDGRKIPAEFKELFKQNPKLRSMYFANAEFRKHFESPAKAAEFVESIETLGGVEGIRATQAEFAEIDKMFAEGDGKLLEKFVESNKDGFAKLAPAVFDQYYKADPEGYAHEIAKVMASTFNQAGMSQALTSLKALTKDNPEAAQIVDGITNLIGGISQLATNAPASKKVDPERAKLEQERKDFESQKAEVFRKDVSTGIAANIQKGIKTNLDSYLRGKKLDTESYSMLESNVNGELARLLQADATFQAQKDAVLATKDKARIQKFFQARIDKYLPLAAKKVMRTFGNLSPVAPTKKEPAAAAPATVQKISKAPEPHEIDWDKTSTDEFFDNRAVLKNGRKITWTD